MDRPSSLILSQLRKSLSEDHQSCVSQLELSHGLVKYLCGPLKYPTPALDVPAKTLLQTSDCGTLH